MKKDVIFASPLQQVSDFVFDEHVVNVFKDMILRSVPGYDVVISMIGILAEQYAQTGSRCYDLGCSTGAVTLVMRHRIRKHISQIIAVDNSQSMVSRCKDNIIKDNQTVPVQVILSDILDITIENASVVALNYTLQFVSLEKRADILKNIYTGLLDGGVLVLSEKISFHNADEEKFQINLHENFKRLNGYTELEISQKRTALENVLVPETLTVHIDRLTAAGFSKIYVWFQTFNFVSIVALK